MTEAHSPVQGDGTGTWGYGAEGVWGTSAAETQSHRQAGVRGAETTGPQSGGDRKVETCS